MRNTIILASQSRGRKALLSLLKIPFEVIPSTLDEDKIIGKTPLQTIKLRAKLKGEEVAKKVMSDELLVMGKQLPTTHNPQPITIISADSGAILDNQLIGKPKDYNDAVKILTILSGRRHEFMTAVCLKHLTFNTQHSTNTKKTNRGEDLRETVSSLDPDLIGTYPESRSSNRDGGTLAFEDPLSRNQTSAVTKFITRSFVTFKKLTPDDIKTYLSMTKYTRYAGAYALFICPKCPRPGLTDLLSTQKYHDLLSKTCKHTLIPNLIYKIEGSISNVIGLPLEKLIPSLKPSTNN